ncbi:MAG: hypothetical protein HYY02_07120 [Chloroflexi bacterium]|nr:hypothetical protein [Chloroflexota bacterium]
MKLDDDQYDFSKKLRRAKVKGPEVAKALARIAAAGEKHVVLRAEDGTEVVAMSLEEYESLMETIDVLSDEETVKAIKEAEEDIRAGRLYTHEEVFGHPLPKPEELP